MALAKAEAAPQEIRIAPLPERPQELADPLPAQAELPPSLDLLPPENLGVPVNTAAHELDPAVSLEGFGLYFSSN
ncbi:MAG: hypothetical protein AMK72_08275, partial [Planctomycetes bacterium SM23_25]